MPSRVDVLFRRMPDQLAAIEAEYTRDLTVKRLSDDLLLDIAHLIEDCQRVLDWTATDIDVAYGKGSDRSPYFPLQKDPAKFSAAVTRNFAGVPTNVRDAMERHQPYQPGKAALGYLHELARVNKHQDFTPSTRDETRWIEVQTGGASIGFQPYQPGKGGISFGPGTQVTMRGVPVDPQTLQPLDGSPKPYTETIYVDWLFDRAPVPKISVLGTLRELTRLVAECAQDVRHEAAL